MQALPSFPALGVTESSDVAQYRRIAVPPNRCVIAFAKQFQQTDTAILRAHALIHNTHEARKGNKKEKNGKRKIDNTEEDGKQLMARELEERNRAQPHLFGV